MSEITLEQRQARRQAYIDRAVESAKKAELSLTCQDKPVELHGTCAGLRAAGGGGLGCLCTCHDAELSS
jgi:hypothetical protein